MKIQNLFFLLFLTGCSFNFQEFKTFWFFKNTKSCSKIYKKTSLKKSFSKQDKKEIVKKIESCIGENKNQISLLVFERFLKDSKRQNKSLKEIKTWEKKLAELSFYQLKNYDKALKHYTSLLRKPLDPGERFSIQYHIAESFFYLKKYNQSFRELKKCFIDGISMEQKKQVFLLTGRVLIAQKKFDQAILFFEKQIQKFPEEENFFREYLALIYETKKDLLSAIQQLEKIDSKSLFIKQKIQRLADRQNNQPGF